MTNNQRWRNCNTLQTQGIVDIKKARGGSHLTNSANLQLYVFTRRWRTRLDLKMDNRGREGLLSCRHPVLHIMWELEWKLEGKRGFCWDCCMYVFSLRYCHTGIADLRRKVVSQGRKIDIYLVISFPHLSDNVGFNATMLLFCFGFVVVGFFFNDWCLHLTSLAFILITLQVSYIRFGTTYWDMSIRCFEYWVRSMQDHHLNLCIVFIIIIFIAPSHKENSIVMVYRSPKTFFVYLVHCL